MYKRITFLTAILALFMAALMVARLFFLSRYWGLYGTFAGSEIITGLLHGLRFDLSTAATMLSPFIVLLFFPGVYKPEREGNPIAWLLLVIMLPFQLALISYAFADVTYFGFAQRHLTFELVGLLGDISAVMKLVADEYLLQVFLLLIFLAAYSVIYLGVLGSWLMERNKQVEIDGYANRLTPLYSLLMIIMLEVLFIRGGVQMKPLGVKDAFRNENVHTGLLALNGVYTTFSNMYDGFNGTDPLSDIEGFVLSDEEAVTFYSSLIDTKRETALAEYPLYRFFTPPPEAEQGGAEAEEKQDVSDIGETEEQLPLAAKPNVVIFVMESWSAKFSKRITGGLDGLPNFDELSKQGLLATMAFSNAQRSVEGMAAILASIPSWNGMLLGQSPLLYQIQMNPLPNLLAEEGYETLFIHGAHHGSMGFDGLARRLGFRRHLSKDGFKLTKENSDGVWGVYDEYVFRRANEEFKKMAEHDKPFFSVIFSLTSHSPYRFPYSGEFPLFSKDTKYSKFLNSLRYSDYSLGQFFKLARQEAYYQNTIFIVVGDHTEGQSTSSSLPESYHIPLLLIAPQIKPAVIANPVTQLDITPTVVDILGLKRGYTSFGKSLLSSGAREAVLPRGELFVYIKDGKMLLSDLHSAKSLTLLTGSHGTPITEKAEQEKMMHNMKKYLKLSQRLFTGNRLAPSSQQ